MKCICGYSDNLEENPISNGKVKEELELGKFKEIYFYGRPYYLPDIDFYLGRYEVEIYACPKCGTLKIDLEGENKR